MAKHTAHVARLRRHHRVRRRVAGTPERPRLAVFRSNQHIYAQLIDDVAGRTIAAASDAEPDMRESGTKTARAQAVGKRLAERSKQAGIDAAVFDRGGFRFAGRVKALADAAREEGLVF
jgi:large subunit ribosomal protein L18